MMTDLKPKIFIGSSTIGYDIAEKVKMHLSVIGDCSTFDNLLRMASYFDFGIFVATADDLTSSGDKLVVEPRDNVILEMALFLGAMGRDKSFLLVEEGIKLPSDFNGIFMPRFNKNNVNSIENSCKEYITKIAEHYRLGHLSLYPTTALAIGYYKNFVADLVESIQHAMPVELGETVYNDFKLKVVMPADLKGVIRQKADLFYKRHGFAENALKTQYRKHPAWFQLDPLSAPLALMYDMPSTLTGIDDAIEMILQKGFQGQTKLQEIIEQRELNNFKRVLQILIDKSPYAQATVEIIDEF